MQTIITAIYGLYNSNTALKAALPGGLHIEMAPQNTSYSYGTFSVIYGRPEYMFDGETAELPTIQFDIYATTNALRLVGYEKLIAVFDDATPIITDYNSIIMERTIYQFVRDGEQNELYRAVITYDCRFEKK